MARTELLVILTPIQVSDDEDSNCSPSAWEFNDNVFGTAAGRRMHSAPAQFMGGRTSDSSSAIASSESRQGNTTIRDTAVKPASTVQPLNVHRDPAGRLAVTPVSYQPIEQVASGTNSTRSRPATPRQWRQRPSFRVTSAVRLKRCSHSLRPGSWMFPLLRFLSKTGAIE